MNVEIDIELLLLTNYLQNAGNKKNIIQRSIYVILNINRTDIRKYARDLKEIK